MASPWQRKVHHLSGPATVCSHSQPCHIDEGAVAVAGQCQKVRWPSQQDRSMSSDCIGKASPLLSPRVLPIKRFAERRYQPFDDFTLAQAADSLVRVSRRAANDPSSASIDIPSGARSGCTQPPSSIEKNPNSSWHLAPQLRDVGPVVSKRNARSAAIHAPFFTTMSKRRSDWS
jgi:hypothetical protein